MSGIRGKVPHANRLLDGLTIENNIVVHTTISSGPFRAVKFDIFVVQKKKMKNHNNDLEQKSNTDVSSLEWESEYVGMREILRESEREE